jgi:hypothetical protein
MDIATWKHTSAGPVLYVCGVEVRDWLGVAHDAVCERFCKAINQAYADRGKTFVSETEANL